MCPAKKEVVKSNVVAATQEKNKSITNFSSVKAGSHHDEVYIKAVKKRDEISRFGNLDWD